MVLHLYLTYFTFYNFAMKGGNLLMSEYSAVADTCRNPAKVKSGVNQEDCEAKKRFDFVQSFK